MSLSTPGMMKHISDQVLVMHNGEVVERGSTADVLASPLHDLTRRLIAGHFGEAPHRRRLAQRREIAGRQRQGGPHAALVIQVEGKRLCAGSDRRSKRRSA